MLYPVHMAHADSQVASKAREAPEERYCWNLMRLTPGSSSGQRKQKEAAIANRVPAVMEPTDAIQNMVCSCREEQGRWPGGGGRLGSWAVRKQRVQVGDGLGLCHTQDPGQATPFPACFPQTL